MAAIHLTKQDFIDKVFDYENNPNEWQFKGDKPAIIDFFASWCGPCKMLGPIMDDLADEYTGSVDIYKVDTEAEMELAGLFGIRSIPSILFIPMGETPQMAAGALPKDALEEAIQNVLKVEKK
ncbi:MAG: thioredoxin [Bacteroidales bacterium]|uniref:thioredoxin n=1 Tax=Porphyromonas sp. TaxID=1924944 RepID=UPI00297A5EBA|nr:thioredoxin [Porphyromonas sp.]MDD7438930.1 thioredoxin [Bacteroidales bacterium]MDY3066514.1 thioredoxin [Porphyromonas sp.]